MMAMARAEAARSERAYMMVLLVELDGCKDDRGGTFSVVHRLRSAAYNACGALERPLVPPW
jgi:hypothetical protein